MNPKDAIRELSENLQPARNQFAVALYRESFRLLDSRVMDSGSAFWTLPNHALLNFERVLGNDLARLRAFFLLAHSRRHDTARRRLGEPPAEKGGEFEVILKRCYQPAGQDVHEGLLELPEPLSTLNRGKLMRTVLEAGKDMFLRKNEATDPNERGRRMFRVPVDPWYVQVAFDFTNPLAQVSVESDVCIGMGPLNLERQLSLHSIMGIGCLGCDFAEPDQEQTVATVLVEQTRLLIDLLRSILNKLHPGPPVEEIRRIEAEWIASFRARRGRRPRE